MGKYKIFETDRFLECLSDDFEGHGEKIAGKLRDYVYPQLRTNPHSGRNIKKLRNYRPETWRYRIGDHRLFYEIDESEAIVYLLVLDSRKDVYR